MNGEECYKKALELYTQHEDIQREKEERHAKEQYEAMMNVHQHYEDSNNDDVTVSTTKAKTKNAKIQNRQANVAVVQTIVKQTKTKRINDSNHESVDPTQHSNVKMIDKSNEIDLIEEANRYMQYAALIHGHPQALVQLANEALEKAKSNNQLLTEFPYPHITPTMNTIIDDLSTMNNFTDVAKTLYQKAIDMDNNTAAMFNLAHLLWTESESIECDAETKIMKKIDALTLFHKAGVEYDDPDALYFLGFQYISLLQDEDNDDYDNIQTSIILPKLLDQNNIESLLALRERGYDLIQKASKLGHGGASYYLSLLHRNGDVELRIEPSLSKFQYYLDEACQNGNSSDAFYLRGHCKYHKEDGYGEESNPSSGDTNHHHMKEALDDFIKAGELGNHDGYISAGALLFNGNGSIIPQDQRRAFELYQEAAEMGSKEGWRNVVACYALGTGVPKCEQTAKYISETMLKDDE